MDKTGVLVMLEPEDTDAQPFRDRIEHDAFLRERVTLQFGKGDAAKAYAPDAHVIVSGNIPKDILHAATNLRWAAFWMARA